MKTKSVVRLTLALGIPVLALLGLEALARFGLFGVIEPGLGERLERIQSFQDFASGRETGLFSSRPYVGFGLNPDKEGINSLGYRDLEFPLERTPGVPRIACLGASTTEGSMAENGGSYPLHLRALLAKEKDVTAEVLNFGVSGWTSAESLVNYNLVVEDYHPDLVIIHHSINDVRPRLWPNYKTDYSHYRRPWRELELGDFNRFLIDTSVAYAALQLSSLGNWSLDARMNVPFENPGDLDEDSLTPDTARGYVRNLRTLVRLIRANHSVPLLTTMPLAVGSPFYDSPFGNLVRKGVFDHNQRIRDLAEEEDVLLLDMAEIWSADPETYGGHFIDHVHVSSFGNQLKARNILELLETGAVPGILE